jgi:hypothetical protein
MDQKPGLVSRNQPCQKPRRIACDCGRGEEYLALGVGQPLHNREITPVCGGREEVGGPRIDELRNIPPSRSFGNSGSYESPEWLRANGSALLLEVVSERAFKKTGLTVSKAAQSEANRAA